MQHEFWNDFIEGNWQNTIDVRDFIQKNYTEYTGDDKFLSSATERTNNLMKKVNTLFEILRKGLQLGPVSDKI